MSDNQDDQPLDEDDPWGAAIAEQAQAEAAVWLWGGGGSFGHTK